MAWARIGLCTLVYTLVMRGDSFLIEGTGKGVMQAVTLDAKCWCRPKGKKSSGGGCGLRLWDAPSKGRRAGQDGGVGLHIV